MTDPTDPPRRLYRARDESIWALIRQRYLSGETQKTLALAYEAARPHVPHPRTVDWSDLYPVKPDPPHPGETWTSIKQDPPESMRGGPLPRPGPWRRQTNEWAIPGYGPMPPHLVPPVQRPPSDDVPPVKFTEVFRGR